MEFIYLLIAFIIMVSIATYILWKKIPPAPETYQKLVGELYDEVCKLNNEIQKKDKEIQRLNDGFRIVKAKAVEIKGQVEGEVLKYVREGIMCKTKCPYGIHQFIGSLPCMECEYHSKNLGNYTMICLYKIKNQKVPDRIILQDERKVDL